MAPNAFPAGEGSICEGESASSISASEPESAGSFGCEIASREPSPVRGLEGLRSSTDLLEVLVADVVVSVEGCGFAT